MLFRSRFIQHAYNIATDPYVMLGDLAAEPPHNASTVQWIMGEFTASPAIGQSYDTGPPANPRANNRFYGDNEGAPINIVVSALTPYLNVYPVDLGGALDFKLRLASAIEQGTLEAATIVGDEPMLVVPYSGTKVSILHASDFVAKNYNNIEYGLFKVWNTTVNSGLGGAVYDYTYIRSVSVSIPATEAGYNYYTITNIDGNPISTPVNPTATDLAYVGLRPSNMSGTTDTKITITVTDVFGFTKSVDVPLRFTEVP